MMKREERQPKHLIYGFSLTELIIVIAMITILASLALPSYRNATARSDRATALSDINQIAQALERFYTYNRVYTNDFGNLAMGAAGKLSIASADGLYHYAINNAAANDQTYSIVATPVAKTNRDVFLLRQNQIGVQQQSSDGVVWSDGWP